MGLLWKKMHPNLRETVALHCAIIVPEGLGIDFERMLSVLQSRTWLLWPQLGRFSVRGPFGCLAIWKPKARPGKSYAKVLAFGDARQRSKTACLVERSSCSSSVTKKIDRKVGVCWNIEDYRTSFSTKSHGGLAVAMVFDSYSSLRTTLAPLSLSSSLHQVPSGASISLTACIIRR